MNTVVEIPGGKAFFREKRTGKGKKLLRSAGISVATNLSDYPELFEPPREGETVEARAERLEGIKMRLSIEQADTLESVKEATVLALLDSWTLEQPLPTSMEELEALDEDLYDALLEATVVLPDSSETDFSPTKEKLDAENLGKAPLTGGSTSSQSPSEDSQPLTQTTTPSTDGSPTSGESSSLAL